MHDALSATFLSSEFLLVDSVYFKMDFILFQEVCVSKRKNKCNKVQVLHFLDPVAISESIVH